MIITRLLFVIMILLTIMLPLSIEAFQFDNPVTLLPLQLEIEHSVLQFDGVKLIYVALTDKITNCSTICYPTGFHIALAKTEQSNYFIGGADFFIKITGGNFWHRWGLGLSIFDRQTEELQTPWDIHTSMQSGWRFLSCSYHHWSNGRGAAERLHLEQYWPDKNDGANALTCGAVWEF